MTNRARFSTNNQDDTRNLNILCHRNWPIFSKSSKPMAETVNSRLKQGIHNLLTTKNDLIWNYQKMHFNWKFWKKILIATVEDCFLITQAIIKTAEEGQIIIGLNCEGIDFWVKTQTMLVAISTTYGDTFVFDIFTCPEMVTKGGLKRLLECNDIIKIVDDCSKYSLDLYEKYGILLRNIFDIKSAHTILQYQNHMKFLENGEQTIPLERLCEIYGAPANPLKDHLVKLLRTDKSYWTIRPLSPDMLLFAASNVLVLVNEKLYKKMAGYNYFIIGLLFYNFELSNYFIF